MAAGLSDTLGVAVLRWRHGWGSNRPTHTNSFGSTNRQTHSICRRRRPGLYALAHGTAFQEAFFPALKTAFTATYAAAEWAAHAATHRAAYRPAQSFSIKPTLGSTESSTFWAANLEAHGPALTNSFGAAYLAANKAAHRPALSNSFRATLPTAHVSALASANQYPNRAAKHSAE